MTQHGSALRYLGKSVMVCPWGCHFSLHKKGTRGSASAFLLRATSSAQLTRHMCNFPNKTDHDVIGASYHDILMMLGILDDEFTSVLKG